MAKLTISELRKVIRKILLKESGLQEVETSHLTTKAQKDFPLVQAAKEGDQKAFSRLANYYKFPLYQHVLKHVKDSDEAEDIAITALQKAFDNIKDYDASFAFSTWLYKITNNLLIDFLRKKKLDTTSLSKPFKGGDDEVLEPIPVVDSGDNPEQGLQRQQVYEKLRKYVDKLSEEEQKIIKMRFFDEKSYEEMAQELELPMGTVKNLIFRAKEALTKMVKKDKEMRNENKKPQVSK